MIRLCVLAIAMSLGLFAVGCEKPAAKPPAEKPDVVGKPDFVGEQDVVGKPDVTDQPIQQQTGYDTEEPEGKQ